jgi:antitoxin component YwqK of YwqJK toxin-antitoxin module
MKQNTTINQRDENGLKQGMWKLYYTSSPSKLLCIGAYYKDGWRHGLWAWYHHNGLTKMRGEYKAGNRLGLWYEEYYND